MASAKPPNLLEVSGLPLVYAMGAVLTGVNASATTGLLGPCLARMSGMLGIRPGRRVDAIPLAVWAKLVHCSIEGTGVRVHG